MVVGKMAIPAPIPEPDRDCTMCPRLAEFRRQNSTKHPTWFNGAVPSFGAHNARLLIVGLAPGLQGANKTGRPFTGDYAGDLLYATLLQYGFARGDYAARADDGLTLVDCMISNAVRCVPPQNKPTGVEISTCRAFLQARISALTNLKVIIALGRVAHDSTLTALCAKKSEYAFAHGALHVLNDSVRARRLVVLDSYHCSRYNTNTGRLTSEMFHDVFEKARSHLKPR